MIKIINYKIVLCFILFINIFASYAKNLEPQNFWQNTKNRIYQIWIRGNGDLYVPTYTLHNRYSYDSAHIARLNEWPRGMGFGKSIKNENGN